ncbi:MAG: hypothetical protein U0694_25765 [Anaerolineae bacterium]
MPKEKKTIVSHAKALDARAVDARAAIVVIAANAEIVPHAEIASLMPRSVKKAKNLMNAW